MHGEPEPPGNLPFVALTLAVVAIAMPLFLWGGLGREQRPRARVAALPDLSELDPAELARARTLLDQLDRDAEERFLLARTQRVTTRTPQLRDLLESGDFEAERVRGGDYALAAEAWLEDLAAVPERAASRFESECIPPDVQRYVLDELQGALPDRLRAGQSRVELGRSFVDYIDFIESHRERMHYEPDGTLRLDRDECVREMVELRTKLQQFQREVETRCPPIEDAERLGEPHPFRVQA